ncbi:MAG: ribose 5-phosphate isomerase B [Chloroflexi bacterium]|jgi:ribose 5-phosphate isomerase B|nr:ribose 5-phosphate isomerase B [Chloroflexota bacterium]MBT4074714.1 ribose 5-phosphate isomerase B [Chloroflexota bacterium]MBT5318324.1 ribose 5-phosphate isomerase B [Chloroflexota bacterium]MBT6682093.1 ribose 5-phosphate isomerase B [Chloroflexota bacterium]
MKIAISGDHAGLEMKNYIRDYVSGLGHEVVDHGAHEYDADDDFPDLAAPVARAVANGDVNRGIILCGSGVGASVAANKVPGVRAAMCHDTYSAAQGVQHDDMNVLCMGARIVGVALAEALVDAFLGAEMDKHPRFQRRLDKVIKLEKEALEG